MELKVRRPKKEDLNQISLIFKEAVKNNFKENIRLNVIEKESDSLIESLISNVEKDLNTNGKREYHLIATASNKIVGIVAYGAVSHIIVENLNIDFNKVPEVKSVYIHPEFQGKGVGSLLFEKILSELERNKISEFCLDSGFKKAQRFWKKKLGKPKVILADYWAKGVPHMIWLERVNIKSIKIDKNACT